MAVAKKSEGPQQIRASDTVTIVKEELTKHRQRLVEAIPQTVSKYLTPERIMNLIVSALKGNARLAECEPYSICSSVVNIASLGLEPNTVLGEAWVLPFWNAKTKRREAQAIIGYKGWLKLVNNTGELQGVKAQVVRENDEFAFDDGIDPFVQHRYHHIKDRGAVVGYWAAIKLKNGFTSISYLSVEDALAHKQKFAMTRDKDSKEVFGVWVDHFDEMALKTALLKAMKYVPKSSNNLAAAVILDEQASSGVPQGYVDFVPDDWRRVEEPEDLDPITMPQAEPSEQGEEQFNC